MIWRSSRQRTYRGRSLTKWTPMNHQAAVSKAPTLTLSQTLKSLRLFSLAAAKVVQVCARITIIPSWKQARKGNKSGCRVCFHRSRMISQKICSVTRRLTSRIQQTKISYLVEIFHRLPVEMITTNQSTTTRSKLSTTSRISTSPSKSCTLTLIQLLNIYAPSTNTDLQNGSSRHCNKSSAVKEWRNHSSSLERTCIRKRWGEIQ